MTTRIRERFTAYALMLQGGQGLMAAWEVVNRAEQSLEAAHRGGGNRIVGAASASPSPAPASLRKLRVSVLPANQPGSARRQGD